VVGAKTKTKKRNGDLIKGKKGVSDHDSVCYFLFYLFLFLHGQLFGDVMPREHMHAVTQLSARPPKSGFKASTSRSCGQAKPRAPASLGAGLVPH